MKTMFFRSAVVATSLGLFGLTPAFAAEGKKPQQPKYETQLMEESPFEAADFEFIEYTEEELGSIKKLKPAKRNPAGNVANLMSPEFIGIRDRFLKVKTADELDQVLSDLNAKYDTLQANDSRLFAAQAVTLIPFRGVVWRLIPVAQKAKITHSAVLTMVKQISTGIGIFLPTQQWQAAFDYVSLPYARGGAVSTQLENEAQVQSFFSGPVMKSILQARNRVAKIDLKGKDVVWDNQLLYGPASFQDDLDRYRLVGEVERWVVLANLHSTVAQLAFARAYSAEGSSDVMENIGRLYGIDGWFSGVEGAPARDRVKVMRSGKFAKWGTLVPDGAQWTKASLSNLRASSEIMASVWNQIQRRPMGDSWSIDPTFFQSRDIVRTGDMRVEDVVAMMKGPAKIRSAVTGETVTVNIPAFYENPPRDLKALLATGFNTEPEWKTMTFATAGKSVALKARNYDSGSPAAWDLNQYRTFLPEVQNGNDVKRAARVLSQSWGGGSALAPMLVFMN
ncbi:MAG: hypothetical protein V4760_09290 [Bdellovibrionota bacterium]